MKNSETLPASEDLEAKRLANLLLYQVLESPKATGQFRHVAKMAQSMFDVPVALVSFVDEKLVWFKGNAGMEETDKVARENALCSIAILNKGITILDKEQISNCDLVNPNAAAEQGMQFYAAAPIISPEGYNLGVVCLLDKKERELLEEEKLLLSGLADMVMEEIIFYSA